MSEEKRNGSRTSLTEVVWERIRAFFVARDLKQYWLGMFGGVRQASVHQWLNKESSPSIKSIEALAKSLGVKPKCLLCDDDATVCKTCTPQRRPPRQSFKL